MYLCWKFFSIYGLAFILLANLVLFVSVILFRSKWLTWLLIVAIMWLINMNAFERFMNNSMSAIRYDAFVEFASCFYFMLLRIISFCMDKINATKRSSETDKIHSSYSLVSFFAYTMYPSFMFVAMFIPFESFLFCVRIYYFINKELILRRFKFCFISYFL